MNCLPQISEAEYEVMKVVWKESPVNTNAVTEILTKTTNWSPKTIQTLLKRLVNKGALTYEKQGRVFVYMPLVQESTYVRQKSRSFLKRYFDGDMSEEKAGKTNDGVFQLYDSEGKELPTRVIYNSDEQGVVLVLLDMNAEEKVTVQSNS